MKNAFAIMGLILMAIAFSYPILLKSRLRTTNPNATINFRDARCATQI